MLETRAEIDCFDQEVNRLFVQESQVVPQVSQARTSAATVRTPVRCQVMLQQRRVRAQAADTSPTISQGCTIA